MSFSEEMKNEMSCCICLELFDDPRTLKCSHSFCRLCIEQISQSEDYRCPLCRRNGIIPKTVTTIKNLTKNVVASSVVEKIKSAIKRIKSDGKENKNKPYLNLFIKTYTGKTINFDEQLKPSDLVLELKLKIKDRINIPVCQQWLMFSGRNLENNHTLESYRISDDSTIQLAGRLPGGNKV